VFGELVETCQQSKKATKGPKGQKDFYSFADEAEHFKYW